MVSESEKMSESLQSKVHDKDGKLISVGDILRVKVNDDEITGYVEFLDGKFYFCFKPRFCDALGNIAEYKPEIIGNIRNNPDLLEVDHG